MTSTKLMELLDENKKDLSDKLYLDMANLLKEKHMEEVNDNLKLVEIVYVKLKFKHVWYEADGIDANYTAYNYIRKEQVYVYKQVEFPPNTTIHFQSHFGKKIMFRQSDNNEKILYITSNQGTETLNVEYEKYTLATCVDVE